MFNHSDFPFYYYTYLSEPTPRPLVLISILSTKHPPPLSLSHLSPSMLSHFTCSLLRRNWTIPLRTHPLLLLIFALLRRNWTIPLRTNPLLLLIFALLRRNWTIPLRTHPLLLLIFALLRRNWTIPLRTNPLLLLLRDKLPRLSKLVTGETAKSVNRRSITRQDYPREMPVFRQAVPVPNTQPPPQKITTTRNPNGKHSR